MSNGDTAAEILDFVENEGADMPAAVTNKMIAMVLREKHHNAIREAHGGWVFQTGEAPGCQP